MKLRLIGHVEVPEDVAEAFLAERQVYEILLTVALPRGYSYEARVPYVIEQVDDG